MQYFSFFNFFKGNCDQTERKIEAIKEQISGYST